MIEMRFPPYLLHLAAIIILWSYFDMHATAEFNTTSIDTSTTLPDTTQMYTTITFMPTVSPSDNPSSAPTQEPTLEPTFMPSSDPTMNPTMNTVSTASIITVKVEIKITVINATEEAIKEIIEELIDEHLPEVTVNDIKYEKDDINNVITYKLEIEADSKNEGYSIKEIIESDEFKDDLIETIEDDIDGSNVTEITTSAQIIDPNDNDDNDDDDKTKAKWLDPTTYGLLNWIIIAAAFCILCVFCLFLCRCCFLCCRSTKMKRTRSGYQVGQAMFKEIDSNAEHDSAFQSDLKSAIEMNSKGKLLNKVDSLGSLDPDAVNTAFDMDFDERKPMVKNANNNDKKQDVKKAVDEDNNNDNNDNNKKKLSEGIVKPETATTNDTILSGTTPGGPTPGGPTPGGPNDEDEHNPPPAPPAPNENPRDMQDYDLL